MFKRRDLCLLLAGAAIFVATVVCGGTYGAAPAPTQAGVRPAPSMAAAATEFVIAQPTATSQADVGPTAVAPAPAIQESRRVTLEYPPQIRAGDSDVVRLTLEVDTLGNVTPTAETQGHTVTGQTVQIPNLYDTHFVVAEARLDLAGVDVRPDGLVSEPLLPGQAVTFYWSVHPSASGTYRGTAWLFLRFVDKVTKEETRRALSAQPVQISTSDLLGIGGVAARTVGGVGSVVGAVLGFPFADDLLKWLWKRLKKSA